MTTLAPASPLPTRLRRLLVVNPLILYFTLAYAFSWAVEIPLVAVARGWTTRTVPFALHYLAAFGPLAAAVITTWAADGPDGLRRLGRRVVQWRVRPIWWICALAPLVLFAVAAVALRIVRGSWTDLEVLGRLNFLPSLGLWALPFWIVTFGIGEETGWRGFALPRLQQGRSALTASLLLGLVWAAWHLPTLFYLPSYVQHGVAAVPGLLIGITLGSIVLTWLVNGSRGSVLVAIVWHGTFNYVTAAPSSDQAITAFVTTAVLVWAVIVVLVWRRRA
jgi:CAAX protease family protein